MQKTASQVQADVFGFIKGSPLAKGISGGVYKDDTRPRGSRKEDAVVVFTTGIPGEVQEGVVTVNIFVPDIKPGINGVFVKDTKRCMQVEMLAQQWADSLTAGKSDYIFSLKECIHTSREQETNQHFVVVKLNYRIPTF